jgi:hypothetical protein
MPMLTPAGISEFTSTSMPTASYTPTSTIFVRSAQGGDNDNESNDNKSSDSVGPSGLQPTTIEVLDLSLGPVQPEIPVVRLTVDDVSPVEPESGTLADEKPSPVPQSPDALLPPRVRVPSRLPRTGDGSSLRLDDWRLAVPAAIALEALGPEGASLVLNGGLDAGSPAWVEVAERVAARESQALPTRLPTAGGGGGREPILSVLALICLLAGLVLRGRSRLGPLDRWID